MAIKPPQLALVKRHWSYHGFHACDLLSHGASACPALPSLQSSHPTAEPRHGTVPQSLAQTCAFRYVPPSHRTLTELPNSTSPQTQPLSLGNCLQQFLDNIPQTCSYLSPKALLLICTTLQHSLQGPPASGLLGGSVSPYMLAHPFQEPNLTSPMLTQQLPCSS